MARRASARRFFWQMFAIFLFINNRNRTSFNECVTVNLEQEHKILNMEQSAQSGDLHALAQLGVYYLLGHLVSRDVGRGFEMIKNAAEEGEIASQTLLATLYAAGMGTAENWHEAYNWLVIAAQNGDPKAVGQITHLLPQLTRAETKLTWQDIRELLDELPEGSIPEPTMQHDHPAISTINGFIDNRTCAYIMRQAAPRMQRAYVNDGKGGAILDSSRTNSSMSFFPLDNDLVIQRINRKISKLVERPISFGEPLSVLHYTPGQTYKDHHDYFNPDYPAHRPHLKEGGQRIKTFLVYLNDDYEGGETCFPKLNWSFKGKAGDAILFDNVSDKGHLIEDSLHAGLPTKKGEKWLMSKWLKDKAQY